MSDDAPVIPLDRAAREAWRSAHRSRRKREVRAVTVSSKRTTLRERHMLRVLADADLEAAGDFFSPVTRGDCAEVARPCPHVSCRHHLYLDVSPRTGAVKLNYPDLEPGDLPADGSCSLDVADRGGATLERTGELMNLTRERIRQAEERATSRPEIREAFAAWRGHEAEGGGESPLASVQSDAGGAGGETPEALASQHLARTLSVADREEVERFARIAALLVVLGWRPLGAWTRANELVAEAAPGDPLPPYFVDAGPAPRAAPVLVTPPERRQRVTTGTVDRLLPADPAPAVEFSAEVDDAALLDGDPLDVERYQEHVERPAPEAFGQRRPGRPEAAKAGERLCKGCTHPESWHVAGIWANEPTLRLCKCGCENFRPIPAPGARRATHDAHDAAVDQHLAARAHARAVKREREVPEPALVHHDTKPDNIPLAPTATATKETPMPEETSRRDQILAELRSGPKTRAELAAALGIEASAADTVLCALRRSGEAEKGDGYGAAWSATGKAPKTMADVAKKAAKKVAKPKLTGKAKAGRAGGLARAKANGHAKTNGGGGGTKDLFAQLAAQLKAEHDAAQEKLARKLAALAVLAEDE